MNRYQILIEYVGTNFRGWQIQKKGPTIQGLIQEKLSKLLKEKIVLHGQGRTDAGVHAFEQSAHFDCKNKITDEIKFLNSEAYVCNNSRFTFNFTQSARNIVNFENLKGITGIFGR